jgi:hypothetical protein
MGNILSYVDRSSLEVGETSTTGKLHPGQAIAICASRAPWLQLPSALSQTIRSHCNELDRFGLLYVSQLLGCAPIAEVGPVGGKAVTVDHGY